MKKHWKYLFCAALDVLWGKERQLFEVWILRPHGLCDHLCQLHGCQCRTQPAVAREHVDTGLDQTDGLTSTTETWADLYTLESDLEMSKKWCLFLCEHPNLAQDLLSVWLQLGTQLHPGEVGLQQEVGLHMGVVELGIVQFVGHLLCQLEKK